MLSKSTLSFLITSSPTLKNTPYQKSEGRVQTSISLNGKSHAYRAYASPNLRSIKSTPQSGGLSIDTPDPKEVMDAICEVSPLASNVIHGTEAEDALKWTRIEDYTRRSNPSVATIEKVESYCGITTPLLRFRTHVNGPFKPGRFAALIMDVEQRSKWDPACESVNEIYPLDLKEGNEVFGDYGVVTRLGVGHCTTKPAAGGLVSPREQMTFCGINEFQDGAIVWGFEMPDDVDLWPEGSKRKTRARSHLFSTTMKRTETGFDLEYCLQLEIGGKIPAWSTTPIVVQTIRSLFKYTHKYFGEGGGVWDTMRAEKELEDIRVKVLGGKEELLLTV